jgi:hypothetical protein
MKTITAELAAHLAQPLTTMTVCWMVVRTDGVTFAFTSFDEDLVVSGVTYQSTVGFSRSAISTGSRGSVDNLECIGFFSDDAITQQDMENGLYYYASVYIFAVNWMDLTQGICRLRHGWLGETILAPDGMFIAELRGLTQALVQEFGNVYSPTCRADFGDTLCKIPVFPQQWQPNTLYEPAVDTTLPFVRPLVASSGALQVAIFQAQNSGTSGSTEPVWNTAIGATTVDGSITWLSMPYFRGIGTVVSVTDESNFVSGPLTLPGVASVSTTSAIITVWNNISAGTSLEISDGINTFAWHTYSDLKANEGNQNALSSLYAQLAGGEYSGGLYPASDLDMTYALVGDAIYLTNNSGQPGSILKTGDYLGGFTIQDFGTSPLTSSTIVWITGANAGTAMELKLYNSSSSQVTLWLAMNFPIQAGDTFFFDAGCDKTRITCQEKYGNILNNRSEPDMPGMDAILSYPDMSQ